MRDAIGWLLRVYAYLYHLILSVFLIGVSGIAMSAGKDLKLGVLPWEGPNLTHWAMGLGVLGLICIFLAVTGLLRYLFPLWTLVVLVLMFRGFFLSPFDFGGADALKGAIWLTVGSLGAFLSSLSLLTLRRKRR